MPSDSPDDEVLAGGGLPLVWAALVPLLAPAPDVGDSFFLDWAVALPAPLPLAAATAAVVRLFDLLECRLLTRWWSRNALVGYARWHGSHTKGGGALVSTD